MAFANNLNEKSSEATRRLKESLREFPAITWNDVYNRYEPYMELERRDSRSKQENPRYDSRSRDRYSGSSSRFRKERDMRDTRDNDRSSKAKIDGYSFNVSTSELVAVLRSMGDKVRWLKEIRLNPNRRNPDFWCEFHNDHGHKIAYCRLLQDEVEHLLKQDYLTRRVRQVLEEDSITFDDADTDSVLIPHNDALVISLLVYDTNVKRVLIDPGSSVNIILLKVVNEMQADDKLVPKARTLSGFDNSNIVTKEDILLTTFAEGVVKATKFQVIDMDMAYNMILGRPWIHEMDDVPSTLH
ncbi:uncharacterized protein [Nicotiana sylvestris]|uniref:uncharacterized protein n=1 Tax=Nicotiana sylvestris TaxID=4096 RepID=UPI00388C5D21